MSLQHSLCRMLPWVAFVVVFFALQADAISRAKATVIIPPKCLKDTFRPSNFAIFDDEEYTPYAKPAGNTLTPITPARIYRFNESAGTNGSWELFFIRGVGYSPIPPSPRTYQESFDFFTPDGKYYWERDLRRIKDMGSNTIRVWSWNSYGDHTEFLDECYKIGLYVLVPFLFDHDYYKNLAVPETRFQVLTDWNAFVDSVQHHPAILGFLIGNEVNTDFGAQRDELFGLLNIMLDIRDEHDMVKHLVTLPLSDVAFVSQYYNPYFAWSRLDFWSLQTYRPKNAIQTPIQEYYLSYAVNQTLSKVGFKPLVITEFGVDALKETDPHGNYTNITQPELDYYKQASYFCEMFSVLRDNHIMSVPPAEKTVKLSISPAGVVAGTLIMEWNDEWWKGTYASVRAPECPNMRTDLHTWCSHDISSTPGYFYFLHEEWLGLASQFYDESGKTMCIQPRMSYYTMQIAYGCNGKEECLAYRAVDDHAQYLRDGFSCQPTTEFILNYEANVTNTSLQWCAKRRNIFKNGIISMIAPVTIITIIISLIALTLKRSAAKEAESREEEKKLSRMSVNEEDIGDGTYKQEELPDGAHGRKLRNMIADQFLSFCNVGTTDTDRADGMTFCPYFRAAQERLFKLIWDKYVGFDLVSEELLVTAARIVYEQYMEGYYLWVGTPAMNDIPFEEMIKDLALYNIIQTWAGTINHSPEKIFEIFDAAKDYFRYVVGDKHYSALRVNQIQDFHQGLVEIFRAYYLKIDQANLTFEDVNTDAIQFRQQKQTSGGADKVRLYWEQEAQQATKDDGLQPEPKKQRDPNAVKPPMGSECPELDLLPTPPIEFKGLHPYLEYHKQRNPEETLLSDFSFTFFELHQRLTGHKWIPDKDTFSQRGGIFTMLFNYGWVVRFLLWQFLWALYLQPPGKTDPVCMCTFAKMLARLDSAWMMFSFLMHFRILWRITPRLMYEGVTAVTWFVAVFMLNAFTAFGEELDNNNQGMGTLFGMGLLNGGYILFAFITTGLDELRLILSGSPPYPIPGRFTDRGLIRRIRCGFFIPLLLFSVAMWALWLPVGGGDSILGGIEKSNPDIVTDWPSIIRDIWLFFFVAGAAFVSWGGAKLMAMIAKDPVRKAKSAKKGREESHYLVMAFFYWGLFFASNWLLAQQVLVPAVYNIGFHVCECEAKAPRLSEGQRQICEHSFTITCYVAVAFTWLSSALVSFVALYAVFEIEILIFGLIRGKNIRVGNVKTWQDVERNYEVIRTKCMKRISTALLFEEKQNTVWNQFVDALYSDSLLNEAEQKRLKATTDRPIPDFGIKPRSEEAIRRITYHLWSLESLLAHDEVGGSSVHSNFRKAHRVRTMPTWTCVVPAYNETVVFEEDQLTRSRTEGKVTARITEIEYLVHTYPDEWENLAERLKKIDSTWVVAPDNFAMDMLDSFLKVPGHGALPETLRWEIRWWATMRGQTLARTMAGVVNWRQALVNLLMLEEEGIAEEEAQRIVSRKVQFVVAHQTYKPGVDVTKEPNCPAEESMEICFRKLRFFDLVFNDDKNFQSIRKRLRFDVAVSKMGKEELKYVNTIKIDNKGKPLERKLFNYFPTDAFEYEVVQRVGRLKIGEGKAENQMHALQFVNGMVLQAMDMNQYLTLENGYKLAYLLSDFFNTPHNIRSGAWDGEAVIPQYRILGFPEWCYTRPLSLVGELMGAAEWCFVTITQRVLFWPLRIRAHYGHPDFFDAYWVRNRGGQSKASPLVNTNEDIFAGYEMLGRGEQCAYIEFIEGQKGRETSFGGAFTFEAKLAQGAAQQIRSFDVYRLNRGLDAIQRFSLFFSSLAFYVTNLLMAVSVNYYILSIALFAVSGITYHELGLLDATIAIPWLIQIGYVLALPFLVEMIIQRGFWRAVGYFLSTLPPSVIFFVFHLRTKTCYFTQGLLIGKGGYAGTGRGFGLDRNGFVEMYKTYSESHFHESLLIAACLIVYAMYSNDPLGAYVLRCFLLLIIVFSWFWAPIIFNPAPTTLDLQADTKEMLDWVTNTRKETKKLEDMSKKLRKVHFFRIHELVGNLIKECKNVLGGDVRQETTEPQSMGEVTLKTFKVTDALAKAEKTSDLRAALQCVHGILLVSKEKIKRQLDSLIAPNEKVEDKSYDQIVAEYWGAAERDSWEGWWLKAVVMLQWESEDQFFPGLVNLTIQKIYLTTEVFLPWILLCVDQYHIDSIYFMFLIGMALFVNAFVDSTFRNHHEYTAVAKGSLMLTLPSAVLFFYYSLMVADQLMWSLILYCLIISLIVRAFFGSINAGSKFRLFGMSGNPHQVSFKAQGAETDKDEDCVQASVTNRTREMQVTNEVEEFRFSLFAYRLRYIQYISVLRSIIPLILTAILVIGNVFTVIFSEWITAMSFNGRVNEAWKKAYLRPTVQTKEDHGPDKKPEPLTRSAEVAQDEVHAAQAAIHGSISASLQPSLGGLKKVPKSTRNTLASKVQMTAPTSHRTLVSMAGSFDSRKEGEELSDALLGVDRKGTTQAGAVNAAPDTTSGGRPQLHFLTNFTDKYKK